MSIGREYQIVIDLFDVLNDIHPPLRDPVLDFLADFYTNEHPHENDFNYFRKIPDDQVSFMDVGANIGLSALSMHKCSPNAIGFGFEPNPILKPALDLTSQLCYDYKYKMIGISDNNNFSKLIVPLIDGFAEYGEASFSDTYFQEKHIENRLKSYSNPGNLTFENVDVKCETLDQQTDALYVFLDRKFRIIKIDVEGYELQVLKGAQKLVSACSPLILIEAGHKPHVLNFLMDINYFPYQIRDDLRVYPLDINNPTLNTLFINQKNKKYLIDIVE